MAADENIPDEPTPPPGPLEYGEYQGFATDNWRTRHAKFRSLRDIWFSYILFGFIIWVNLWWDFHIISWVRSSGTKGTWLHFSDNVLIALATTSVANFIGLVVIVAKHLFPEMKEEQEASK